MPKSSNGRKPSTHETLAEELKRYTEPFRTDGSQSLRLKSQKTCETGGLDRQTATEIIERNRVRLAEMQKRLYAAEHWAVLLILQGMDAAGKDSAIKHIFTCVNPQGVDVTSFKIPSTLELRHDFLWRTTVRLPKRGRLGIFNRSYYEECLTVRVHQQLLAKELIPSQLVTRNVWRERFEDISAYEKHLSRNGTLILKFFLNISKEEQRKRLLDRLQEPSKRWKFSMNDIAERELWGKYLAAYQDTITHTATKLAPWHVVPADRKWFARVVISSTIVSALEGLRLQYPRFDKASLQELEKVRAALEQEGRGSAVTRAS